MSSFSLSRNLLLHITHYDPKWIPLKEQEPPFDLATGLEVVEAMGKAGMDSLVVDIEDGVVFRSHPELMRHYSVPMSDFKQLADAAHHAGIDIIPKLNFAKSGRNQHDIWMRPHMSQFLFTQKMEEYFQVAADVIAELIEVGRPKQFFHIGMDEDHFRSLVQYVEAIERLREIVSRHGLRTMIWNDSAHDDIEEIAQVHAEKSIASEPKISKDIAHVIWHYNKTCPEAIQRLTGQGFEVWGAPGRDVGFIRQWRDDLLKHGGSGVLMTNWLKCIPANRQAIIELIELAEAAKA